METEIFTCRYFKFGRNTTGLSQSHLRNFLACSINRGIHGYARDYRGLKGNARDYKVIQG